MWSQQGAGRWFQVGPGHRNAFRYTPYRGPQQGGEFSWRCPLKFRSKNKGEEIFNSISSSIKRCFFREFSKAPFSKMAISSSFRSRNTPFDCGVTMTTLLAPRSQEHGSESGLRHDFIRCFKAIFWCKKNDLFKTFSTRVSIPSKIRLTMFPPDMTSRPMTACCGAHTLRGRAPARPAGKSYAGAASRDRRSWSRLAGFPACRARRSEMERPGRCFCRQAFPDLTNQGFRYVRVEELDTVRALPPRRHFWWCHQRQGRPLSLEGLLAWGKLAMGRACEVNVSSSSAERLNKTSLVYRFDKKNQNREGQQV